jgi:hypothetical protein
MGQSSFFRVANLLVEVVDEPDLSAQASDSESASTALNAFATNSPGSWVGGRLGVSPEAVTFAPNTANSAAYAVLGGIATVEVPYSDIRSFGVLNCFPTKTIWVRTTGFLLSLRCWRADKVVAAIQTNWASE